MTKIDIFSGFLGAGKTTLIKKLIKEAYNGEKVVLIENEFGDIGIDGGFLEDAGIEITEMNSGCICCSLVGDFTKALGQVLLEYSPDRIIIEPSGVGKLSDVIKAAKTAECESACLNSYTTVVDINKCKMYMKNFGEFFNDQIEHASTIVFSHTSGAKDSKVSEAVELVREHNGTATIVVTPWELLDGKDILKAMEKGDTLGQAVEKLEKEHAHHHGEECHCHDHEHHHEEECSCGCGGHHHHHHHADEVFNSFGRETTRKFTQDEIKEMLTEFAESDDYGMILRAKGIVEGEAGKWIHFDYVPGEIDIREGSAGIIGRICVIGSSVDEEKVKELFKL